MPQVRALYDRERAASPTSTLVGEAYWQWMLEPERSVAGEGWRAKLIVNGAGQSVGYVLVHLKRWGDAVPVLALAVEPGVGLPTVLPSVLRALQAHAPTLASFMPDQPEFARVAFVLGRKTQRGKLVFQTAISALLLME